MSFECGVDVVPTPKKSRKIVIKDRDLLKANLTDSSDEKMEENDETISTIVHESDTQNGLLHKCTDLNSMKFLHPWVSHYCFGLDNDKDFYSVKQLLKPEIFKLRGYYEVDSLLIKVPYIRKSDNIENISIADLKKILKTKYYQFNTKPIFSYGLKDNEKIRLSFNEATEIYYSKKETNRKQLELRKATAVESTEENKDTIYCSKRIRNEFGNSQNLFDIIYPIVKHYYSFCFNNFPRLKDNSEPDKSVIGLLYSGGKDSTCRLLELLEKGERVVPIINTLNYYTQSCLLRNISAINTLCELYKRNKKYKGTLYRPEMLTHISYLFPDDFSGFCQQQYNVVSLSLLGETFLRKCKRIEFCLIVGDQSVSYIDVLKKIYNSCMNMNMNIACRDIKIPPLTFPCVRMCKEAIKEKLSLYTEHIFGNSYNEMMNFSDYSDLYIPTSEFVDFDCIYILNDRNPLSNNDEDTLYLCIGFKNSRDGDKNPNDDIVVKIPLKEVTTIENKTIDELFKTNRLYNFVDIESIIEPMKNINGRFY